MIELSKKILEQVSFDKDLFIKELKKAIAWIEGEDKYVFRNWCLVTFGKKYEAEMIEVFSHY